MTNCEPPITDEVLNGSGVLSMLVRGFPIDRTLDAVASVAGHLEAQTRSAVLLMQDDRLLLAAQCRLLEKDYVVLSDACAGEGTTRLKDAATRAGAQVRMLITQSAELVGAIVVFGLEDQDLDICAVRQIDEVASIATLAIEQQHLSEELSYRAHHDPLTHLYNRIWMEEAIGRALDNGLETGRLTGLIVVGLDSFRLINGLLGNRAGNELLQRIAARLQHAMEPGFLLARGGGDEFYILIPELASAERVNAFAARLLSWFVEPFEMGDHELLVRASVGTATVGPGECDAGELQHRADTAMRHAKKMSRGHVARFEPSMISMPPERLVMEKHLRFALQKREFEVFYQPQLQMPSGKIAGVEALLRWKHPSLGYISPATFIPILEDMGSIDEVGDWVLGEAIRQLEIWHSAGLEDLRMAVNISPVQFSRSDFANLVARRLRTADIRPEDLELEVTEGTIMTNFEHGLRQLTLLRSLGVMIALDDFGTGHSSLAYLQQLPIQRLKIDQMFVRRITKADERPPLLAGIVQMGHNLGCSVIAEGVETTEQAFALLGMRCTEMQGFLFSKALPPKELIDWANKRTPTPVPCPLCQGNHQSC